MASSSESIDQLADQRVLKFSNKRNENESSRAHLSRASCSMVKAPSRKIAQGYETALDAPGVVDDFCNC